MALIPDLIQQTHQENLEKKESIDSRRRSS